MEIPLVGLQVIRIGKRGPGRSPQKSFQQVMKPKRTGKPGGRNRRRKI